MLSTERWASRERRNAQLKGQGVVWGIACDHAARGPEQRVKRVSHAIQGIVKVKGEADGKENVGTEQQEMEGRLEKFIRGSSDKA